MEDLLVHGSLFLTFVLFLVQEFDIATHLDTLPELVDRVYNRPTIATLQKETLKGATDPFHLKVLPLFLLSFSSCFNLLYDKH